MGELIQSAKKAAADFRQAEAERMMRLTRDRILAAGLTVQLLGSSPYSWYLLIRELNQLVRVSDHKPSSWRESTPKWQIRPDITTDLALRHFNWLDLPLIDVAIQEEVARA